MLVRIAEYLEGTEQEKSTTVYRLVSEVLDGLFQDNWVDEKRDSKSGDTMTTWVVVRNPPGSLE